MQLVEDRRGALAHLGVAQPSAAPVSSRPAKMLPVTRQVREAEHLLVDHADAALERVARAAEVQPLAVPVQLAGVGLDDAGQDLEQRGLAGAVLADERVRLALARRRR